jgi:EAL domain-containing protein (putative c-di-GMP-specific phosphodiesterase class I)
VYRSDSGEPPYTLAINLSGTTLNDARFLDFLLDELSAASISTGSLCFEITETAAIANLGHVVHFMRALKARGCRFSLDDFGTGLSSLTYLKNLPVDYVKIDGQFVRSATTQRRDALIVSALVALGKQLRLRVIAEGVETKEHFAFARKLGCAEAQGFHFGHPMDAQQFEQASAATRSLKRKTSRL